jgi:transposase
LTDLCGQSQQPAMRIRNIYLQRWDCETAIEFLKSKIGMERFMVQRYISIQRLIILASLAMGFLSYLLSRTRTLWTQLCDPNRYFKNPKRLWHFRLIATIRESLLQHAQRALSSWRHPP